MLAGTSGHTYPCTCNFLTCPWHPRTARRTRTGVEDEHRLARVTASTSHPSLISCLPTMLLQRERPSSLSSPLIVWDIALARSDNDLWTRPVCGYEARDVRSRTTARLGSSSPMTISVERSTRTPATTAAHDMHSRALSSRARCSSGEATDGARFTSSVFLVPANSSSPPTQQLRPIRTASHRLHARLLVFRPS